MPTFPPDFLWGAATSAYQIEGSLDADGRGRSVWEDFCSHSDAIEGGADASIACDSYLRWQEDFAILSQLGLNSYRFSIGWSRVIPEGTGPTEPRGLDHYERQVDALLERGISPVVTLNHWDMPSALMANGGWMARSSVGAFAHFCEVVAERIGDRVEWWITQNEPWIIQLLGYQLGLHAPGVRDLAGAVAASHHLLLAHGAGYDAMRPHTDGRIGAALNLLPCVPASEAEQDRAAAWGSDGYVNRWFLDPLLSHGYPPDMREHWERAIGVPLTVIRDGDESSIAGRSDYLAVNFYTHRVMASAERGTNRPFPWRVVGSVGEVARTDEGTEIVPDALRDLLLRLHRDYPGVPLMVTENGAIYGDSPTHDGRVHDVRRIRYLRAHLSAIGEALEQGVPVLGYMHWSLLDNFEWALGYRPRFGLVYVDFRTGERIVKDSGLHYAEIARAGALIGWDGAAPATVAVDSLGAFG